MINVECIDLFIQEDDVLIYPGQTVIHLKTYLNWKMKVNHELFYYPSHLQKQLWPFLAA